MGFRNCHFALKRGDSVFSRVLIAFASKGKYYLKVVCVSLEIGLWFCGFLLYNKD